MKKELVCFHLYNDFGGSPKVFAAVLESLVKEGYGIQLVTSSGEGALSVLEKYPDVVFHRFSYAPSKGPRWIFRFLRAQIYMFFKAFQLGCGSNKIFYINTILPVSAAIAARLMGKKTVYHYHEHAVIKGRIYRFLTALMERLADDIICVSDYQRSFLRRQERVCTVHNALSEDFLHKLKPDSKRAFAARRVLMLASMRDYKGIPAFLSLTRQLPQYNFSLVLNESPHTLAEAEHLWLGWGNLRVYPRQAEVADFFNEASVVLNLSDRRYFIETFGMTVLEAISAGLPAIAPTVGGVTEIIRDGENGFLIDVADLQRVKDSIVRLLSDENLYCRMSKAALDSSKSYNLESAVKKISNFAL